MQNNSQLPVHFIISAPRSGSTWLQRAINAMPDMVCTENRFFGNYYDVVPRRSGPPMLRITLDRYIEEQSWYSASDNTPDIDMELLRKTMLRNTARAYCKTELELSGKSILVDKVTPYSGTSQLVLKRISECFPEANIVQLIRDGRDVAVSGLFDWIYRRNIDHPRYRYFVEGNLEAIPERLFTDEEIIDFAVEWNDPIKAFASISPDSLLIRYESLKTDFISEFQNILKAMGVKYTIDEIIRAKAESSFENFSKGRKPGKEDLTSKNRKGISGDWKNYMTRKDGILFSQVAGKTLIDYGFENDSGWINLLPDKLAL